MSTTIYRLDLHTEAGPYSKKAYAKKRDGEVAAVEAKRDGFSGALKLVTVKDQSLKDKLCGLYNQDDASVFGEETVIKEFEAVKRPVKHAPGQASEHASEHTADEATEQVTEQVQDADVPDEPDAPAALSEANITKITAPVKGKLTLVKKSAPVVDKPATTPASKPAPATKATPATHVNATPTQAKKSLSNKAAQIDANVSAPTQEVKVPKAATSQKAPPTTPPAPAAKPKLKLSIKPKVA